jgi:glycosyltransferase involved in cell wall biosynthesis
VCSLVERNNTFLSDLISSIEKQITGKAVELLILSDNAKRPVGTKRNDLLNISKGKYVCFIDDDDRISETYVDDILQEIINWSPDVVVFDAEITFNGTNPRLAINKNVDNQVFKPSLVCSNSEYFEMYLICF